MYQVVDHGKVVLTTTSLGSALSTAQERSGRWLRLIKVWDIQPNKAQELVAAYRDGIRERY